ncbi:cytochrome P450 [Gordonia sp. LSe1-13]|uniref:Cytochrome P450 n=1 Tax=Gordonia sesuvii TaxID=3116777 RepID=A0ABU7M973_9ACTN|nr:cytochrome P450 [Gordonia sp. LSe1-13]
MSFNEVVETYPFPRDSRCPMRPSGEYARRRDEEPLNRLGLGRDRDPWLVTRYRDAVSVLGDAGRFSSNPAADGFPRRGGNTDLLVGRFLFTQDPPKHTRLRGVLTEEFSVSRVNGYREMVTRVVAQTLDEFVSGKSSGDFVSEVAFRIPGHVMFEVLGMPHQDRGRFLDWITQCLGPVGSVPTDQASAAARAYQAYVDDFLAYRERTPSDDVIGRLVRNALEPGLVTREELLDLIQALITGGFDTTAHTMAMGTFALLTNPDQLALLRNDPSLAGNAVEEILRTTAVTHTGRRRVATEDVLIGDQEISAGDGVIVSQDAVNRDDAVFAEPDVFDITRKGARRHMTFGFGIHLCLGSPLARMELQEVFGTLFAKIPTLELAVPEADVEVVADATILGLESLQVRW